MSLLEVKDLKTYFYTDAGVGKAVDGVSFSLDKGKVLGIVGESGCGKSVTSLSIMRLVDPTTGRYEGGQILFNGQDLLKLPEKEMQKIRGNRISMIFQEPMTSLNPVFTIGYQIEESLMLHKGMNAKQARERAIELLELVGIPEAGKRVDEYPHQLSGGMRQRVMIAMALAGDPELLIADEPTTALDVTIQAQILDLGDVCRRYCGEGQNQGAVRRPQASLHHRPDGLHSRCGGGSGPAADAGRPGAQPVRYAGGLPVRTPVQIRLSGVRKNTNPPDRTGKRPAGQMPEV